MSEYGNGVSMQQAFAYDKESLDVLIYRMMDLLSSMIKEYRAYGEKKE